jgi:hypothetical protein
MPKITHIALSFILILTALPFSTGPLRAQSRSDEPQKFFREFIRLDEEQVKDIRDGKPVAKILDSPTPDEVFIFGSVFVRSTPERYLTLASDLDALRKLPSYLALQKISEPPRLADFEGFTLTEEDINHLQHCKAGHCEVQLPTETMEQFQRSVNWSSSDKAEQVDRLAQQMALEALARYQKGGNSALGTYRDKSRPAVVAETFKSLLDEMKAIPAYLPELYRYLLDYPNVPSSKIDSQFYWEKVNFGLKPTLRMIQAVIYRGTSSAEPAYAVAVKQLYASHYFETALDLTVCVRDSTDQKNGFYLITLKGSRQAGLSGFKGGIVRKVAVDKTRSSLQRALESIKQKLEAQAD